MCYLTALPQPHTGGLAAPTLLVPHRAHHHHSAAEQVVLDPSLPLLGCMALGKALRLLLSPLGCTPGAVGMGRACHQVSTHYPVPADGQQLSSREQLHTPQRDPLSTLPLCIPRLQDAKSKCCSSPTSRLSCPSRSPSPMECDAHTGLPRFSHGTGNGTSHASWSQGSLHSPMRASIQLHLSAQGRWEETSLPHLSHSSSLGWPAGNTVERARAG